MIWCTFVGRRRARAAIGRLHRAVLLDRCPTLCLRDAQLERIDNATFAALALTKDQKLSFVIAWGLHQKHERQLVVVRQGLLSRLAGLPSNSAHPPTQCPTADATSSVRFETGAAHSSSQAELGQLSCTCVGNTLAVAAAAAYHGDGDAWMHGLLGACPTVTQDAADVLSQLQDLQWQWLRNYLELHDRFGQLLEAKQQATFQLSYFPHPDVFRWAVMACASVVHEHESQRLLSVKPSLSSDD